MNVYIRSDQNYELVEETNFKQSIVSTQWLLRAQWWNGSTSFSNIWFDTTNGRIYSSSTHSLGEMFFNHTAYDTLGTAKKIKIIYDYLYLANNTSYYESNVWMFWHTISKRSSWRWESWAVTYNPTMTSNFEMDTPYSAVMEYDLVNDTGTFVATKISDQTKLNYTLSWAKQYWTKTTSDSFFTTSWDPGNYKLGWVYMDQWSTCYFGDMHIYAIL